MLLSKAGKTGLLALFKGLSALCFVIISFKAFANNPVSDYVIEGKPIKPWKLSVGNAFEWGIPIEDQQGKTKRANLIVSPIEINKPNDAINVKWRGKDKAAWFSNITLNGNKIDLSSVEDKAALNLEIRIHREPTSIAKITMRCNWKNDCQGELPLNPLLSQLPQDEWTALTLPLNCFNQEGQFDFKNVTDIFAISTQGKMELDIANVYLVALPEGNKGCKK
ncbi:putative glycoside hydrolase [Catenovulum sediminis]|uniref:putative glycoside hydrolase n=1 Tax=Catenovulum sediminis TaxID=1740262 RepID=UPI00117CAFD1|nr:putative glycoside hydrolase [Catenovulum sediminis]